MRFGSIRFLVEFKMDYVGHHAPGRAPNPGHKTSMAPGGRNRHAGHSVAMFRDKFWLSFALTIPVVFWSTDVQHWLGYMAPSFPGFNTSAAIDYSLICVTRNQSSGVSPAFLVRSEASQQIQIHLVLPVPRFVLQWGEKIPGHRIRTCEIRRFHRMDRLRREGRSASSGRIHDRQTTLQPSMDPRR